MIFEPEALLVLGVSLMVLASAAWLALHGARQGLTLRWWAAQRGLSCHRREGGRVERELEAFGRDDEHLIRNVGRVREIVELGDGVRLVRCEEEMDLAPWATGTGPARTRIAVLFPARDDRRTISVFDRSGRATGERAPGLRFSDPAVSAWIEERIPEPPHPLSVSMAEGRGMAYLLTASGGVSADDLDYLATVAECLAGGGAAPGEPEAAADGQPPRSGPGPEARRASRAGALDPRDRRARPRPAAPRPLRGDA